MHAPLLLLTGTLLLAPALHPRTENPLGGAFGIAQQASLNQVDILLDLWRQLPPELRARAAESVSAAQKAHDVAVRNLIVVERGTVTADYRRWKLQRAIQALIRADRERDRIVTDLLSQAAPEVALLVTAARERARSETTRAVSALRSLDGGTHRGGAGASGAGFASLTDLGYKDKGNRSQGKGENQVPSRSCSTR
jgi:hypothetical protein